MCYKVLRRGLIGSECITVETEQLWRKEIVAVEVMVVTFEVYGYD